MSSGTVMIDLARGAGRRLGTVATGLVIDVARRGAKLLDPLGDATAAVETMSALDSYLPSLMPRTSLHQGLASGLNVLGARLIGGRVNAVPTLLLGAAPSTAATLAARAGTFAVGHAVSRLPEQADESLLHSGVRSGGDIVRAVAVSGALYDVAIAAWSSRGRGSRTVALGAVVTGGAMIWGARRLRRRLEVIPRWPIEQRADLVASIIYSLGVSTAGTLLGGAHGLTRRRFQSYLGAGWSRGALARVANSAFWLGGAVVLYNTGVAAIGRSNERIEPAYSVPPTSPLVSGSAESFSDFDELGLQGRRFVTDTVESEAIQDVLGEPAVAQPIRVYVGFNSMPLYGTGRAELALEELSRTGAFDRSYLLLVSPTGTGWVDQTVVDAAEYLARGDIATCAVQYGRFPSFLAVQKVGLGRVQFRLLLWGIRQRLAERPPERRPKVLVFGESLGAWTASDVVMSQGIAGFDHYGIDRALWIGLPALAKWSRNGMAAGSNQLVPSGTVGVFDRHEQLAALDDEARERLRAVVLSHDNDPIAALRPELLIRRPEWLRSKRGRNVPPHMEWTPVNTFWQVLIDAANAMVTVPGHFGSFGHDYRGDTTRFVRDALHLPPTTEEQSVRIDDALRIRDVERQEHLGVDPNGDTAPQWSSRSGAPRIVAGIPFGSDRTSGARWFR